MENKKMYDYKLELIDGRTASYVCEGLFSTNGESPEESKVLIKTMTIVDEYFVDAEGKRVEEAAVVVVLPEVKPEAKVEVENPKKKRKK